MRILVDEMPKKPYQCPYYRDNSSMTYDKNYGDYICTYRHNMTCFNTSECPWFTEMASARDIVEIGLYEKGKEEMEEIGW